MSMLSLLKIIIERYGIDPAVIYSTYYDPHASFNRPPYEGNNPILEQLTNNFTESFIRRCRKITPILTKLMLELRF